MEISGERERNNMSVVSWEKSHQIRVECPLNSRFFSGIVDLTVVHTEPHQLDDIVMAGDGLAAHTSPPATPRCRYP